MDMQKLNKIIKYYRPLPALSSLPVAVQDNNGRTKALWFNYYVNQDQNKLDILIKSIFTVGEDMKIEEILTDIEL